MTDSRSDVRSDVRSDQRKRLTPVEVAIWNRESFMQRDRFAVQGFVEIALPI